MRLADTTHAIVHDSVRSTQQLQHYRVDDVVDWRAEEFCCGFSIYHQDDPLDDPTVSIQFTLADAQHHDDIAPEEPGWGLNILVDLIAGDYIINSQAPYNNTDRVWTACPTELKRRIQQVDPQGIGYAVVEHLLAITRGINR